MTNIAFQFNNLLSGGAFSRFASSLAEHHVTNTIEATTIGSQLMGVIVDALIHLLLKFIYFICSFVLNIIELMEIFFCKLLGIGIDLSDYVVVDTSNPLIKMLTNETILTVFKTVIGVAIVLIIVFTIFAIIRSEYQYAIDNDTGIQSKGRIFGRSLRAFFTLGFFPLMLLVGIILVNAVLAGFNDILRGGDDSSISGQIFVTSAYSGNNYRMYADNDKRIPILINFEDPYTLGQVGYYSTEELYKIYDNFHDTGEDLYRTFGDNTFKSFNETVIYRNNKIYNHQTYTGFEKFVCTREQYYVMADFTDYAIKHKLKYYIKSMEDPDINWKYVSDQIYDRENHTLTIRYKDASDINGGDDYTIVYAPNNTEMSTPISDAVRSIEALLAISKFSENTFNIMSRLEDSINVVEWGTDKVYLSLSKELREALDSGNSADVRQAIADSRTDQLILYEMMRYKYGNSIACNLDQMVKFGYTLPVKKISQRQYMPSLSRYVVTDEIYVVEINGNYYRVEKNSSLVDDENNLLKDAYGDSYYTIVEPEVGLQTSDAEINKYKSADDPGYVDGYDINDVIDLGTYNGKSLGKLAYIRSGDQKSFFNIIVTMKNGSMTDEEHNIVLYDDQVGDVIKQVSWPQKLINDLQVIYHDININNLIATNRWLTNLGEYYSGGVTSDYSSSINTSLIHPLGLILSELFLGEIGYTDEFNLYTNMQFSSRLDEDTLKALMLSLMGEENYFQLKQQFDYFNEIYNVFMSPVIDEISYYENFELLNGMEASVPLYTYKAYLASMLISQSAADWFYNSAVEMLGCIEFAGDVIKPYDVDQYEGYYSYNELIRLFPKYADDKEGLRALYEKTVARLNSQGVTEYDDDWPEYMTALYQYLFEKEDKAFDERLNVVLNSWKGIKSKTKKVNEAYKDLGDAYYNLIEAMGNAASKYDAFDYVGLSSLLIEVDLDYIRPIQEKTNLNATVDDTNIVDFTESLLAGRDDFSKAVTNQALEDILRNLGKIRQEWKDYYETVRKNLQMDYWINFSEFIEIENLFNEYASKIMTYVEAKFEYYEQDTSYSYNGKMNDLVQTLNDAAAAIDEAESRVTDGWDWLWGDTIWEAVEQAFDERQGIENKGELFKNFGSVQDSGDFKKAKNITQWEKVEEYVNNLNNLFYGLDTDFFSRVAEIYARSHQLAQLPDYVEDPEAYTQEVVASVVRQYVQACKEYVDTQNKIDRLNRYYITNGIMSGLVNTKDLELDIVVNNKHYTVAHNFTPAKFIEYVLGGEYLNFKNYQTVFVDSDYKGLIDYNIEYDEEGQIKDFKFGENASSFGLLKEFLVRLGDLSANLYQMTNLVNLAGNTTDEITLGAEEGEDGTKLLNIPKILIQFLIDEEYLPEDIIMAFFNISQEDVGNFNVNKDDTLYTKVKTMAKSKLNEMNDVEEVNTLLNTTLSYIMLTNPNKNKAGFVDYTKMTLKDLRINCMDLLVDYEEQEGESAEQNQKRYMAIFALACSDWYYYKDSTNTSGSALGAEKNSWSLSKKGEIDGIRVSSQAQATIMRLAGLDNRPLNELVNAEYTIDFDNAGVDEANGDVFIICTFDEEMKQFVPFMMSNVRSAYDGLCAKDEDGYTWPQKYKYRNCMSDYYAPSPASGQPTTDMYYPVVAKGLVSRDGYPTAIREVNGAIQFYRQEVVNRETDDVGLEKYYVNASAIHVKYGYLSFITNTLSTVFTGKTLIQHMTEAIPRYAAHFDLNLCYGTDEKVVDSLESGYCQLTFNFTEEDTPLMENLYTLESMNFIALIIGVVSMVTLLWKAIWAVAGRMFDITVYFLLGPVVISTIPLKTDGRDDDKNIQEGGNQMYERWKKNLVDKLLGVFAFAIGFNIFFLVVPLIENVTLFADASEFTKFSVFANLSWFSGPGVITFLNEFARLLLLIAAAYLTTKGPEIFSRISATENGFAEGEQVFKNVKNTVNSVKDMWSGQLLVDSVAEAKEMALNMVPGYAIAQEIKGKVKEISTKIIAKAAKYAAMAYGVDAQTADKMSKALEKQMVKMAQAEKLQKERKAAARAQRNKERYEGVYSGGKTVTELDEKYANIAKNPLEFAEGHEKTPQQIHEDVKAARAQKKLQKQEAKASKKAAKELKKESKRAEKQARRDAMK